MTNHATPLVVFGDLHGHLDLFERLLAHVDALYPQARLVTLGDYVDNGPQIPALLDRLIALQTARPQTFFPILGNHDLALLRALGWPDDTPDPAWYEHWSRRYWNPGGETPAAYGARDLRRFERSFPLAHFRFLTALPWYYDDGAYFCVHAGLHPGPLAPQRALLAAKALPLDRLQLPDAIRNKHLAMQHDPTWERVVVSAHTHLPGVNLYAAPRRVCLSATADYGEGLLAVVLPERRCWKTDGWTTCEVKGAS